MTDRFTTRLSPAPNPASALPLPLPISKPGSLGAGLPFCDAGAPLDARVADLVGRLSFEEKAFMLATASGGAPRVGVSVSQWWQEALHGIANNVGVSFNGDTPASTSFPQPMCV